MDLNSVWDATKARFYQLFINPIRKKRSHDQYQIFQEKFDEYSRYKILMTIVQSVSKGDQHFTNQKGHSLINNEEYTMEYVALCFNRGLITLNTNTIDKELAKNYINQQLNNDSIDNNALAKEIWSHVKNYRKNAFSIAETENLVLSGGGAKGFAYTGVIRALEDTITSNQDENILDNIKRVAGNSAGSLIALPVALGYKGDEIEEIVSNSYFPLFFSQFDKKSFLVKNILKYKNPEALQSIEQMEKYNELMAAFLMHHSISDNIDLDTTDAHDNREAFVRYLDDATESELDQIVNQLSDDEEENFLEIFHEELKAVFRDQFGHELSGYDEPEQAFKDYVRCEMQNQDRIENYLKDIVQGRVATLNRDKLNELFPGMGDNPEAMRNLTFKQMQDIAERIPESGFKEFYVSLTEKADDKILKNHIVSHHFLGNMPVATACRMSMNIPYMFESYQYKGYTFVDGLLTSNTPAHAFNHLDIESKKRTLNFVLMNDKELDNERNLINRLTPDFIKEWAADKDMLIFNLLKTGGIYKAHSDRMFLEDPSNIMRTRIVHSSEVDPLDFNLSQVQLNLYSKRAYLNTAATLKDNTDMHDQRLMLSAKNALRDHIKAFPEEYFDQDTDIGQNFMHLATDESFMAKYHLDELTGNKIKQLRVNQVYKNDSTALDSSTVFKDSKFNEYYNLKN